MVSITRVVTALIPWFLYFLKTIGRRPDVGLSYTDNDQAEGRMNDGGISFWYQKKW